MEQSGPVAAAVQAAGYVSEEEEEDESGEGSSIEEDEDEEGLEYADAEAGPLSYSNPRHSIEMGTNGYPVHYVGLRDLPTHPWTVPTSSLPVQIEKKGHVCQPSNTTGDTATSHAA
jgi:hypothetical protein